MTWEQTTAKARSLGWVYGNHAPNTWDWRKTVRGLVHIGGGVLWKIEVEAYPDTTIAAAALRYGAEAVERRAATISDEADRAAFYEWAANIRAAADQIETG